MEITTILFFVRIAACLAGGFWLARKMRGMIPNIVLRLMPPKHRFSENAFRIQTRVSTVVAFVVTLGGAALINAGIEWVLAQARTQTHTLISPPPVKPTPMGIAPPVEDYDWTPPAQEQYPEPAPRPKAAAKTGDWCFQIYALNNEDNAHEQQAALSRRLPRPAQLTYLPGDTGPYKVYVSGFLDRDEAVRFGKEHNLKGFPRPIHQLRPYAE